MEKSNPCSRCHVQKRLERYQRFSTVRKINAIMDRYSGDCLAPEHAIDDLREQFCESCKKPGQYAKEIEDPNMMTYPQDDNFYVPPYDYAQLSDLIAFMNFGTLAPRKAPPDPVNFKYQLLDIHCTKRFGKVFRSINEL